MTKPILVVGYGNPSRGDDALGPLLLDFIEQNVALSSIELITDFQLQIEHALDLQNRKLVLFIDASVVCADAFDFSELKPAKDNSYTSHAMTPAAVLQVFESVTGQLPPPCFLLSIQGVSFELGSGLSEKSTSNFQQACRFTEQLLGKPIATNWRQLTAQPATADC